MLRRTTFSMMNMRSNKNCLTSVDTCCKGLLHGNNKGSILNIIKLGYAKFSKGPRLYLNEHATYNTNHSGNTEKCLISVQYQKFYLGFLSYAPNFTYYFDN